MKKITMNKFLLMLGIFFFLLNMLDAATQPIGEQKESSPEVFLAPDEKIKKLLLHKAIQKDDLTLINKTIKAHRYTLYESDENKNTPLHHAALSNNFHIVVCVLSAYEKKGEKAKQNYLVVTQKNNQNKTAFELAQDNGYTGIASRIQWATLILESYAQPDFDKVSKQTTPSWWDLLWS
jgi:ankyrin repeat protein